VENADLQEERKVRSNESGLESKSNKGIPFGKGDNKKCINLFTESDCVKSYILTMPYVHVTNMPLVFDDKTNYPNSRMKIFGKPIGLWYALGTEWIDTETSKGKESYKYKYEFPLDGKFEENIEAPQRTKIFKLTAINIESFEAQFKPYFLAKMYKTLRDDKKPYNTELTYLVERARELTSRDIDSKDIRTLLIQELTKNIGIELDVEVKPPKVQTFQEMLQPKKTERLILTRELLPIAKGTVTSPRLLNAIRNIEYGNFLAEKMKPKWGGIHYDASLFTDELKSKYPFIEKVEIPSGCMWHPKEVIPEYSPVSVQGGKRTRRRKLTKSTRRKRYVLKAMA
jgi:hypothetical protein